MKITIGLKITIIIFVAIFVTAISINIFSTRTMSSTLQDEIIRELSKDSFFLMEELDRFLFERISDIHILTSQENKIVNMELHSEQEILNYLRDFESKRKVYASISIYNKNGTKIADTQNAGVYRNEKNKPFFKEAMKGAFYSDPRPVLSESLQIPVIHFSGPLRNNNGEIIGVLATRIPISGIDDIIEEIEGKHEAFDKKVDLLHEDGLILFSNHNSDGILKHRLSGLEIFKRTSKSKTGIETVIETDENEETLFVGVRQQGFLDYEGNGWILVTSMATAGIFSPVGETQKESFIVTIIILLLSIPFSLLLAKSLSVPIRKLKNAANEIAKGNLDYEIDVKTKDEIGDLSKTFEQMASELKESEIKIEKHQQELEQQVKERTQQLERTVEEMELGKKATLNIMEDIEDTNKELSRTQDQLRASIEELKALDTQKDQFISIAAHELKTPLTSIKGFTNLLQKENVVNNVSLRNKYLGIIFRDTKRLSELISNILELSRMDIGTLKLAFQAINVEDLINEVKEQMNIIVTQKGLKSSFKIEKDLPDLSIDKDRMVQVISNLINNAVHYTDKGTISVVVKREDEENVLFSVSDTGTGIPKNQLEKIFQRFYQVDNPLTRKIGGTGLGLSLCKGFVEAMNGKIWVESEEGKGSTFYFTIPTKQQEELKEKELNLFKEEKQQKRTPLDEKTKKKIAEEYLEKRTSTEIKIDKDKVEKKDELKNAQKDVIAEEESKKKESVDQTEEKVRDFFGA